MLGDFEEDMKEVGRIRLIQLEESMKRVIPIVREMYRHILSLVHKKGLTWVHILDDFEPGWRTTRLDIQQQLHETRLGCGCVDVRVSHHEADEAVIHAVMEAFPLGGTRVIPVAILKIAHNTAVLGDAETAQELQVALGRLELRHPGSLWAMRAGTMLGMG
jgi:hypothetical protein